ASRRTMRSISVVAGVVRALLLLATAAESPVVAAKTTASSADRIQSVEHGLVPSVRIHGEKVTGMNLRERMTRWKVPEISVAVIDGASLAWARAYGTTEAGGPDSVTVETLFQAGSVSKPIAAMTALHCVEAGRLELDEDVNRRLASWKIPASDAAMG